jgi:hypothetical protein
MQIVEKAWRSGCANNEGTTIVSCQLTLAFEPGEIRDTLFPGYVSFIEPYGSVLAGAAPFPALLRHNKFLV